ncbi:cation-translocating P-type ATPase [Sinomonas sp. P10A9]|uniref:Cation-translocating P-type ATPase n=1 Tax=Sinomonas puerhi TaxID=3238584 RepID=A0AB39L3D0_9MICC
MTLPEGLDSGQVEELSERFGPNSLPRERPRPWWLRLAAELGHFFALMLWAASALAFIAGMPELGWAIAAVVVVNGLFAFFQEARAERASAKLRELLPSNVQVRRDGRTTVVGAVDLVPGDVVLLTAGDRVPADLDFLQASGVSIDESMLTGESLPVPRGAGDAASGGTFVAVGDAVGRVTATGSATRLAEIARLTTRAVPPPSPLDLELKRIVKIIAVVAVTVGAVFFLVSLLIGNPLTGAFLFAIGVTVALVPEGLLPTVTLSLAMGAQRMSRRHALVRNLEAVETLGSTTFICTDKTGTLTQNRMSAVEVWTPAGSATIEGHGYAPEAALDGPPEALVAAAQLATGAHAASQGDIEEHDGEWRAVGDPMEAALAALDRRLGGAAEGPIPLASFAFDGERKRQSVVLDGDSSGPGAEAQQVPGTVPATPPELWVKGAPEVLFDLCLGDRARTTPGGTQASARSAGHGAGVFEDGGGSAGDRRGDDAWRTRAGAVLEELAARGLRVLAVASRSLAPAEAEAAARGEASAVVLEQGLVLRGLIGLHDPPRPAVEGAIRQAREAGIRIAMVTGDHPATAAAIAREIGLIDRNSGDHKSGSGAVLEGASLPEDLQVLGALLDRDGVVISRVTPEQKLRVAHALQGRGHCVAMTGDGVNDGPALEAADIGVAMGRSGTDVARNAADLVLLDDDFATIIVAVEQGRATYANIRRFLTYHLTDNVAELTPFVVWALSAGHFPLALGVLQILFLDIGTDLLPALALGGEKPSLGVLKRPPERRHLMDGSLMFRVFAVLGPVEVVFEMTAFAVVLWLGGWRPGGDLPSAGVVAAASGAAFTAVVLGQLANAYACRSASWPAWRLSWGSNRMLLWAIVVELGLLALFLFVGPVARLLGQGPPPLEGFVLAALAIPGVVIGDALHKALRHRLGRGRTHPVLPHH